MTAWSLLALVVALLTASSMMGVVLTAVFVGVLMVAVLGKLAGSAIVGSTVGESWNRSLQVGTLMNCRGLTELLVLNIGLDLGVLSPTLFTMLVITALVSTAMAAPMGHLAR